MAEGKKGFLLKEWEKERERRERNSNARGNESIPNSEIGKLKSILLDIMFRSKVDRNKKQYEERLKLECKNVAWRGGR